MRIAFCVHPLLTAANEQLAICSKWLAGHGVEAVVVDTNHLRIDSKEFSQLTKDTEDISLVCVLGGDGTILRSTRLAYAVQVPLLGVNFGNLGFLSGATSNELFGALEAFLKSELHEDHRGMLKAEAVFSDGTTGSYGLKRDSHWPKRPGQGHRGGHLHQRTPASLASRRRGHRGYGYRLHSLCPFCRRPAFDAGQPGTLHRAGLEPGL